MNSIVDRSNVVTHPSSYRGDLTDHQCEQILDDLEFFSKDPRIFNVIKHTWEYIISGFKAQIDNLKKANKKKEKKVDNIISLHMSKIYTGDSDIDYLATLMLKYPDFKKYVLSELKPIMALADET